MLTSPESVVKNQLKPLENVLFQEVYHHILELINGSPSSLFFCEIDEEYPNTSIYLIEKNSSERYTICHMYHYDKIGKDCSYQCLPSYQIKLFNSILTKLKIV